MTTSTTKKLICKNSTCGKGFLVIPQEEKFYQIKKLPLPDYCPACRHITRMALRSERIMYKRSCDKCGDDMLSVYPQDAPYNIYCQKCFWGNIG